METAECLCHRVLVRIFQLIPVKHLEQRQALQLSCSCRWPPPAGLPSRASSEAWISVVTPAGFCHHLCLPPHGSHQDHVGIPGLRAGTCPTLSLMEETVQSSPARAVPATPSFLGSSLQPQGSLLPLDNWHSPTWVVLLLFPLLLAVFPQYLPA